MDSALVAVLSKDKLFGISPFDRFDALPGYR